MISCQAFGQRTQYRNPAAHTGFKEEVHLLLPGDPDQFSSMSCHQHLIGSDCIFTGQQSCFYKGISRLLTAHRLYDSLDLGILQDHGNILYYFLLNGILAKIPDIQHILQCNILACTALNDLCILLQDHTSA